MNLPEVARTAAGEIRHHKMRSTLTLLGIILGTLSITVMTSLLDGVIAAVWEGFSDLGYDGVVLVVDRPARDHKESAVFARSTGLQPADADFIMGRREVVDAVAPVVGHEEIVRRGGVERKAQILGVTSSYAPVRNRAVASGRFINDADEAVFARVCVVGHRLKNLLFGTEDAVGKSIALGGRSFVVVGVARKLGNRFVNDSDFDEEMEGLYVPLATLRKFYTGEEAPLSYLAVQTRDTSKFSELQAEVTASLRLAHRGAQDFRVENIAEEMVKERVKVKEILRNWQIVLGSIAGIALLVGGIGLLSVMLIAIGERLYEIGLRKAIGATDSEVFLQFLMESVALSFLGGVLGCAAGIALTKAVGGFFTQGLPIRFGGLLFAIGVSVALGALYGIYPALKASRMEPVLALRSAA